MKEKDGGGRTKKRNNVPVQSGSGAVPGRMRREYPVADFEAAAAAVRKGKKNISFPGGGGKTHPHADATLTTTSTLPLYLLSGILLPSMPVTV